MRASAKPVLFAALSLSGLSLACASLAELRPPQTWEYDSSLGMENVESYTATLTLEVSGNAGTGDIAFDGDVAAQRDPPAAEMVVDATVDTSGQSISLDLIIVFVDGSRYEALDFGLGATCSDAADVDEDDFPFSFVEMFEETADAASATVFEDLPTMEYEDSEEVNGVRSFHYRGEGEVELDEGTLEDAEVDVWVAQDGGYVTRMHITGTMEGGDVRGDYVLDYEVTTVGEEVEIEAPRACD
jgi:hypothetical protein